MKHPQKSKRETFMQESINGKNINDETPISGPNKIYSRTIANLKLFTNIKTFNRRIFINLKHPTVKINIINR